MRWLALVLLFVCLAPARAGAQAPAATPTASVQQADPGDDGSADDPGDDEDATDPVDDEDPVEDDGNDATDPCSGTGDDADYQYCGCRQATGSDGDYLYCAEAGAGQPPPAPRRKVRPAAATGARSLSSGTLPLTGGSPGLVALLGLGLVLTGAGGRMIATEAGPSRPR